MSENLKVWQIWIDTGGTFTDCLAKDPNGDLHRVKVLSNSSLRGTIAKKLDSHHLLVQEMWSAPTDFIRGFRFQILEQSHSDVRVESYDADSQALKLDRPLRLNIAANTPFEVRSDEEAPILAARLVTNTLPNTPLPNMLMRLATTRGTNALLERKGVAVALFITRGFGDLLRIGTQQRPDIFALHIRKPEPLYEAVQDVDERMTADGSVFRPLKLDDLDHDISILFEKGIRAAAIAFLHSYRNPQHEAELAANLKTRGFEHVSCSSELAPFIKIVQRAETAVADAYLAPVIKTYLGKVQDAMSGGRLHVMTSAGGLVEASEFHAKDSLLSGPAGGVVGAALAGKRSGYDKILAFDMGGTSTDVARFDGDFEYVFEHKVGDAHLVAPALAIESVAAGGGSICSYDGYRLKVGPESAAADPGPACYGTGGPLTLTDVNLLLGYLDAGRFDIPISLNHATASLEEIASSLRKKSEKPVEQHILLKGFLDIANERMADAIRRVSVRKGYDPQEYALVAFGGAGGQHACGVAQRLGIQTIIVPQDASLLSAYGLGHAVLERFAERQVLQKLKDVDATLHKWFEELTNEAKQAVAAEGVSESEIEVRRRIVNLRFVGQDSVLSVEYHETISVQDAFETKYKDIFAHLPEGREIEVESVRVVCSTVAEVETAAAHSETRFQAEAMRTSAAYFDDDWCGVPHYERANLSPGAEIVGPALIFERHSATIVETGWTAIVDGARTLILQCVN
ncbi:hydantoinase/oxoprolinase family protein [candidate division KSB1 bacterium]|nr:hydantoinase/oxoprolinase family protein [candidate division KSB1 bacterium]NIR69749.1 hydantoinase/oxoprolinase family protein [candidate division KSB1 bacterium]NIS22937.1 hydantoinase/oxoprolinase family protein [candidate division KSB1 bacterium]NIT69794.1 hydantoinase/oxoprolinase family protein [candidate division KSB1 bacterium]NIU23468.1 hydantoinase/oxoprolinase family protein [candidate division KSB1 bacterium]